MSGNRQLVTDPLMLWKPGSGVAVFSRDANIFRAINAVEILHPPRVVLDNGHMTDPFGCCWSLVKFRF